MSSISFFQFECKICKKFLKETDSEIIIENKEVEENLLFGDITTVHVAHTLGNQFHWNIVTLDKNGEYRGHKHSFIQDINDESEEMNFSLLKKYLGKKLELVIADILIGRSVLIYSDDKVLNSILKATLAQFQLPNKNEKVFVDQISTTTVNDKFDTNYLHVDKKKYNQKDSKKKFNWVTRVMKKLDDLDETAIRHILSNYIASIRNAYYQIVAQLAPYCLVTDACPISDPSSTMQIQILMDNIVPKKEYEKLKSICSKDEFEVIMELISRQFSLHYN